MPETKQFHEAVRERHSVRSFLPTPLPDEALRAVLEDAQLAPSNCNTQPWDVHVVSGAKRDTLSEAIIAADAAGHFTPDFSFSTDDFYGEYSARAKAQGAAYYQAIGVAREAYDERLCATQRNLCFFDAPHVALLFLPAFGDCVRVASDIGMYGQTFLLSLAARGLGGIPQTMLGFYAGTIREVLGVDPARKMLFGISFGYPDTGSAANGYRIDKVPIEQSVTFHH
jgi:nitroreductase